MRTGVKIGGKEIWDVSAEYESSEFTIYDIEQY